MVRPLYSHLIKILQDGKKGPSRKKAIHHLQRNGRWSFKTLECKVLLKPSEIALFVEKACTWMREDQCFDLLGDKRIIPPLRLKVVQRVTEAMAAGNNSHVALWAIRGIVFPNEVPMTPEERRLLLDTFKRPERPGGGTNNLYAHCLVEEYRERYKEDRGLTLEELKELMPFALKYVYEHWYDAQEFLKRTDLLALVTDVERQQIEQSAKKAA